MNFQTSSLFSPTLPTINEVSNLSPAPSNPVYQSTFTFGGNRNTIPNRATFPNNSLYYNNAYHQARSMTQMVPEELYKILLYFFLLMLFGSILVKLTNMGMFSDKDTKYGKWIYFVLLIIFILFVILPMYRKTKKKNS